MTIQIGVRSAWKTTYVHPQICKDFPARLSDLLSYPGTNDVWVIRMHHFSDEFREFLSHATIAASTGKIYGEQFTRTQALQDRQNLECVAASSIFH